MKYAVSGKYGTKPEPEPPSYYPIAHANLMVSEQADTWLDMGLIAIAGVGATWVWSFMVDSAAMVRAAAAQRGLDPNQAPAGAQSAFALALFGSVVLLITIAITFLLDSAILMGVTKLIKGRRIPFATARLLIATAMLVYVVKFLLVIAWSLFLPVGGTPMAQLLPLSLGHLTGAAKLYSLDLFFFSYLALAAWMLRREPRIVACGWILGVLAYNTLLIAIT